MYESVASSIFLLAFSTLITISYLSYKNNRVGSKDSRYVLFSLPFDLRVIKYYNKKRKK